MKTTIRAMLINPDEDQQKIIDDLMLVFCTALRFAFRRLLEGVEIKGLEKNTAWKYNLNIRQAKDAVENARQIIKSQRELVKLNYEAYTNKIKAIEKKLKNSKIKLSEKKRKALLGKLEKRRRRQSYFKRYIDNNTIPPVIFGSKEMFIKRFKGNITNEEWKACRNNRIYSRGDKTKKGNPNLRVVIINGMSFIEISTFDKIETNRALKIKIPIYLPRKFSKKTGKVNGRDYRRMFLEYLKTGEAYQVEIIKRENRYYAHITFEEETLKDVSSEGITTQIIGIDTNPDGFALTAIDSKGNYKWHFYLSEHELLYARSNRRDNLCGELVKKVVTIAKESNSSVAFENLKFKDDKDVHSKFARIKHQFIYRGLLSMLERVCIREGVNYTKVKPQFTSKIGLYKYCHQYKLGVHNGAALVIGRRSKQYKEHVPKILRDKLISNKIDFNKYNEWKRWSIVNTIIKKKGGKTPGLWMNNRKSILGLVS